MLFYIANDEMVLHLDITNLEPFESQTLHGTVRFQNE